MHLDMHGLSVEDYQIAVLIVRQLLGAGNRYSEACARKAESFGDQIRMDCTRPIACCSRHHSLYQCLRPLNNCRKSRDLKT